jgi:crotonobetainyl-CoA:carnitine CoA-transferase CaiB-like acyl-CoA transferase
VPEALGELRVVDLSNTFDGALTSLLFADFGAEVVHVEPPGGSRLRAQPSYPFLGRGKMSIVLDLHDAGARRVARSLCADADVVIETFRPGVAARHGLAYDDLRDDNPALVYGSITAFGREHPLSHVKGYEGVVMAKVGGYASLSSLTPRPGPAFATVPYGTASAAHTLAQGIFVALYERETSGHGQWVETTLIQALAAHDTWNWILRVVAARYADAFATSPRIDESRTLPNNPLTYRLLVALSKDGRWLQFSQTSERLWIAFLRALDLEWVLDDPKWRDAPSSDDLDIREAFWERLLEAVRHRTVADWQRVFDADPDVFAELFRHDTELLHHPQMLHNGSVVTIDDEDVGAVTQPGPLVRMDATPAALRSPAPLLDEHSTELRSRSRRRRAHVSADPPTRLPLEGVTIVELGTFYAAPFGATLLTDYGARVIKIEQLDGDPMRSIVPFPEAGGIKVLQGKESVAVDMRSDEGRQIVYELVRRADAVLQSFRAGVVDRLGYDHDSLLALNPDLVYLDAPGYGTDGPYGHRPAYAPTIGAGTGLARRNAGRSIPERADLSLDEVKEHSLRLGTAALGVGHADGFAALGVGTALALGLLARKRGAPGQVMLTTMLNTVAHALSEDMVEYEGRSPAPSADAELLGFHALYRLYETAEGWIFLAAPTARDWERLATALASHADLAADPRFTTEDDRIGNDRALAEVLSATFRIQGARAWEQDLTRVDVACVMVEHAPPEAVIMEGDDCLGRTMNIVVDLEHPVIGRYPRLTSLATLSRSPTRAGPAPSLGEHTGTVLDEIGYSQTRIADLRARGVIAG